MTHPLDRPFSFGLPPSSPPHEHYDTHLTRRLASMAGYYLDSDAYTAQLAQENPLVYEVYEIRRPEQAGELLSGLSILHPGKVGAEYFMTKGHFHAVLETGEIYHCLNGRGALVMETPEGDWAVEALHPGQVLYVPPRWAHRSVNTDPVEDLVTFFVYPGHAGHDYGTIEKFGFRKLLVEQDGQPTLLDNPRWQPPETRR